MGAKAWWRDKGIAGTALTFDGHEIDRARPRRAEHPLPDDVEAAALGTLIETAYTDMKRRVEAGL